VVQIIGATVTPFLLQSVQGQRHLRQRAGPIENLGIYAVGGTRVRRGMEMGGQAVGETSTRSCLQFVRQMIQIDFIWSLLSLICIDLH
jgi:hypothetical protein